MLDGYSARYPLMIAGSQLKVSPREAAQVLATVRLPYTHPKDPLRYSSAIGNPPGIATDLPAIVLNRYGAGKVVYVASDPEGNQSEGHRSVFVELIKLLQTRPFYVATDAHRSVEITLLHQREQQRYIVNLLSFQAELPNIPIDGITVHVRPPTGRIHGVKLLPDETSVEFRAGAPGVEFRAPRLETFLMFALDYT